ncbi:MAG: peroxidase-related enzyme [Ilumatobacteraceae bacterium]
MREKSGFVPNVFTGLAERPELFRAFFHFHDLVMDRDTPALSKADRELIVVATSAANSCTYCVVAHGAILRIRDKDPEIADLVSVDPAKAPLDDRRPGHRRLLPAPRPHARGCRSRRRRATASGRPHRRRHLGRRVDRRLLRALKPNCPRLRHAPQP